MWRRSLPKEREVKVPIMARDVDPEAVEITPAPGEAAWTYPI